ncbi:MULTISPECIES: sulfatase-like hydrolase/transferase [unclassified Lentimonas]|uniref:sulfatase-like hydrolase/transferase n=1 Tax=unclassified Lentimonas TaxID=2630993 RepID=UPI00132BAC73|nr:MULTISPECIES: sulfatase-like hydrolase/transferase [unclassified Lentimonas]CAA6692402.1 Choline-sulfatase (EC [Lentimonas sp. CC19]CAA6693980.1 Choline-sulfatase (EC [Lentimonas sp. CC10]CAA7072220.1 Choline-sulfatase (EC [Lentimonas sp. CC11]
MIRILSVALVCALPFVASAKQAVEVKKPNIVVLLADDLGYGELGCYGQEVIQTPHIDALAKKGVRFTDFYAGAPVCSPSRAVLMTGIQIGKLSIRGNKGYFAEDDAWDRVALRKSEKTLAEMLKGAGYQTAFIGKWHLGDANDYSTWAGGRGFDYAVQEQWAQNRGGKEFIYHMQYENSDEVGLMYDKEAYDCLDVFRTEIALKYLNEQRDSNKPLFLFMSYRNPHAHELYIREKERYADQGWPELERTHASRITMLDEQIQRLLDKLEAMGELENTFILFTSDNGPHAENGHDNTFFNSSLGLKGHKRDLYEGGIRVPGIAYWKGKIEAGQVSDFQASFHDVMPTLAAVAGIDAPEQTTGISFLNTMMGQPQEAHTHHYWAIQKPGSRKGYRQAVRMGDWKAVRYGDKNATELYDLKKDVYETTDLSAQYPEVVERMNQIILKESTKDPHYPWAGSLAGSNP